MVSLLQISVYGTEELRWWGGCSYGSVLLWTLTVHNHRTKRGHVNNSKHVLMCKLAAKKDHFRHENVHGYRKTYNLINCLQVGAIIWYCVFIWMEHACCLGVKENLMFTSILFLNVKKELIRFVLFLMGSTCALTWNTNKCCMQPDWMMKALFYFIKFFFLTRVSDLGINFFGNS